MKVVIVGGGPRGLSAAERIIEWARQEETMVQITLFDPNGVGGKIWRNNQPLSLKMNSVTCQVTLFTDETLSTKGPVQKGPNLYEWIAHTGEKYIKANGYPQASELIKECRQTGPNDHCSRILYGIYQQWFYETIQKRMAEQTSITFFREMVLGIRREGTGFRVFSTSVEIAADKIVLAMGHQENGLSSSEKALASYANEHRLFYSSPKNAADAHLEAINPKQTVIMKGLGLSFFDYVTLLTTERGGYFERKAHQLIYHPSGNEPLIVAGSRRGFPYHVRGQNQKKNGEEYQPRLLKQKRLNKWKRKGHFPAADFFQTMKKEIELAYYLQLIKEKNIEINLTKFISAFTKSTYSDEVAKKLPISAAEYWDWQKIEAPASGYLEDEAFQKIVLDYLSKDINEAKKGNIDSPISGAFDSLKDLRDEVRSMLDADVFTDEEREQWLNQWFTPLSNFLSIGPPLERIEELFALVEAGIVTLLAPEMEVERKDGSFVAFSKREPEISYSASYLIEARIPKVDNKRSLNPLTQQLLKDGLARLHTLKLANGEKETGALLVEKKTNQLIDEKNKLVAGLFCYGIPTEGIHWLTAATARPYTDPWNLRESDTISRLIFGK